MVEERSQKHGPIDLLARVVSLQLVHGNEHHLESLAKLSIYSATLIGDESVDSSTFNAFVRRFEHETSDTFADDSSFESFVTKEVPFFSRSYLTLQGHDPASGSDVGHLLLAVFGVHGHHFPVEYRRNIRALADVLLFLADYLARRHGYRRHQMPSSSRTLVIPDREEWDALTDAVQFDFASIFAVAPDNALAYIQDELCIPITELKAMHSSEAANVLFRQPFVIGSAGDVVIAAPRDLMTTLRHKILTEASKHDCLGLLQAAVKDVAVAFTHRLTTPLFDPPGPQVDESDSHTRLRGALDSDKRLVVNVRVPPLETSEDVFPGAMVGAMPLEHDDIAANDRMLTLDVVWPMGRELMLMSGDEKRHLIGTFDEFELILFMPGTDRLTLWYFAEAWDRLGETTRILHTGIASVFGMYHEADESFYMDDDSPLPDFMVVQSDYAEKLRRSFATRIGTAQVHIGNRIYESHLKHGTATTVREVLAPPRHIYSAELDESVIWAELVADSDDDAYRLHSFPEAICYWAEAIHRYNPTVFDRFKRDIQVLIEYIGEPDEPGRPWFFEADPVDNKDFVFKLRPPQQTPSDAPANFLDRELVARLARALLSNHLSGDQLTRESKSIVEAVAPPGERRMVHTVESHVDLLAWPGDLPTARRVQSAVLARLLDELGIELRQNRGRAIGEIAESERTSVLNKEVVPFYGDRLNHQVMELNGLNLLRHLLLQNEALIHEEYVERNRYASRLACFGHGPDEAERLAKHLTATNTASVSSRFLIEYTAALHPQGLNNVTEERYNSILALASEVVNKGFISDAVHAGISQAQLSILPSGRLGISRDDDRYTQGLQGLMSATAHATIDEAVKSVSQRDDEGADQDGAFAGAETLACIEFGFTYSELALFTSELVNLSNEEGQFDVGVLPVQKIKDRLVEKFGWELDFIDSMLDQLLLCELDGFWNQGVEVLPWRFNRARSYLRRPLIFWEVDGADSVIFGHRNTIRTSFELYGQHLSGRLKAKTREMKEALSRARDEKGEDFERRVESALTGECDSILRRVHKFGDLDLHDADGVDLGDIDIVAVDRSSRSLYLIEAKSLIVARTPRELKNELSNIHSGEHSAVARLQGRYQWVLRNRQKVLESLDVEAEDVRVVPLVVIDVDLVTARFESLFDIVTLDNLVEYMRDGSQTPRYS